MGLKWGSKMWYNDSGTVGAIPYAILTLIIVGLALVAFGPVFDALIGVDNAMIESSGLPYSEQRADTVQFLLMCWEALAFVVTICVVIFLIMNGAQKDSGGI